MRSSNASSAKTSISHEDLFPVLNFHENKTLQASEHLLVQDGAGCECKDLIKYSLPQTVDLTIRNQK